MKISSRISSDRKNFAQTVYENSWNVLKIKATKIKAIQDRNIYIYNFWLNIATCY